MKNIYTLNLSTEYTRNFIIMKHFSNIRYSSFEYKIYIYIFNIFDDKTINIKSNDLISVYFKL